MFAQVEEVLPLGVHEEQGAAGNVAPLQGLQPERHAELPVVLRQEIPEDALARIEAPPLRPRIGLQPDDLVPFVGGEGASGGDVFVRRVGLLETAVEHQPAGMRRDLDAFFPEDDPAGKGDGAVTPPRGLFFRQESPFHVHPRPGPVVMLEHVSSGAQARNLEDDVPSLAEEGHGPVGRSRAVFEPVNGHGGVLELIGQLHGPEGVVELPVEGHVGEFRRLRGHILEPPYPRLGLGAFQPLHLHREHAVQFGRPRRQRLDGLPHVGSEDRADLEFPRLPRRDHRLGAQELQRIPPVGPVQNPVHHPRRVRNGQAQDKAVVEFVAQGEEGLPRQAAEDHLFAVPELLGPLRPGLDVAVHHAAPQQVGTGAQRQGKRPGPRVAKFPLQGEFALFRRETVDLPQPQAGIGQTPERENDLCFLLPRHEGLESEVEAVRVLDGLHVGPLILPDLLVEAPRALKHGDPRLAVHRKLGQYRPFRVQFRGKNLVPDLDRPQRTHRKNRQQQRLAQKFHDLLHLKS